MLFHPSAEDEYFESLEGLPEGIGIPEIILAMECLTEKQRFVISLRYGLKTGSGYSQGQVADLMGCSQQAVDKLEVRGLKKLGGLLNGSKSRE